MSSRSLLYSLPIVATVSLVGYAGYLLAQDMFFDPMASDPLLRSTLSLLSKDDKFMKRLSVSDVKSLGVYGVPRGRRPVAHFRKTEDEEYEIGEMRVWLENKKRGVGAEVGVQAVRPKERKEDVGIRRLYVVEDGIPRELIKPKNIVREDGWFSKYFGKK